MRRAALLALLLAGGCGSADRPPEEVVKEFVEAIDRGDSRACDELVTEDFVSGLAGRAGEPGRRGCRAWIETLEPAAISVNLIPSVDERGDTATVTVQLKVDERLEERTFRLERRDGEFRVDQAVGG